MIATISPSSLIGQVKVPSSKSMMQRACALALLHRGSTRILRPGRSDDDESAIRIIRSLGVHVTFSDDCMQVISDGQITSPDNIDCGESGLSLRMFSPILALSDRTVTVTGRGTLLKRDMSFFDSLPQPTGSHFNTTRGLLPLIITGPFEPVDITLDGSSSSQYITGLLFAYAKTVKTTAAITVNELVSRPYVDLSVQMLRQFGYDITNRQYREFLIHPVEKFPDEISITLEGDWSSASFFIVAAVIAGDLSICGLKQDSLQSDRAILEVLRQAGVQFVWDGTELVVRKSMKLHPFCFNATDAPDLFPSLVVLALMAEGTSVIQGVHRLRNKESDRAEAIMAEFSKLGATISISGDDMMIKGGRTLRAATVNAHHDHRIAMALAVTGLIVPGGLTIHEAESVQKSFPDFFEKLSGCGGIVKLKK